MKRKVALTTTDADIRQLMEKEPQFRGVLSRDKLRKVKKGVYILNLQPSRDGNGTHWVMLWNSGSFVVYLDSFGGPPPQNVANRMFETKLPCYWSNIVFQNAESMACGLLSVFAYKLIKHMKNIKSIDRAIEGKKMRSFLRLLEGVEQTKHHPIERSFSEGDFIRGRN
jgi:hypothetical protein